MVHDKKVESFVAVGSFTAAVALAFTSLLISSDHDIAAGVLMMCAQFLMLTATIFGLDYKIGQKIREFKADSEKTAGPAVLLIVCLLTTATPSLAQPFVKASHLTYDIIYDYSVMSPAAVTYELESRHFVGTQVSKPKHFKQDRLLPPPRVKNADFTFSGYQRGHLCPSGDRDARKDWYRDTYYTSNIVPMTPDVNAGAWKEVENQLRIAAYHGHHLRIACGGADYHFPEVGKLMVPRMLWKIARCTIHPNETRAWIISNRQGAQSAADCVTFADSLYAWLNPTIASYLIEWIRR